MCRELLVSVRSNTGNRVEQLDFPLPPSFKSLFRDIMVFLLSIPLLAVDPKKYTTAAEQCRKAVDLELSECETALLRAARDAQSHGEQDEYMYESLKTADTLLNLLLQNAFSLSCSDGLAGSIGGPHCDVEDIYRRWTTACVSRKASTERILLTFYKHRPSIQSASAETLLDIRLLREEINVITKILHDQQQTYGAVFKIREGPLPRLDTRVKRRTENYFKDSLDIFKQLREITEEAERSVNLTSFQYSSKQLC